MTKRNLAMLLVAAPLLMLASCEDEPEVSTEDDGREASGEVLEGTISDAMLPVDEVRSQAPLVVESPSAPGGDTVAETPAEAAPETAEPVTETAPAPAAEPAGALAE